MADGAFPIFVFTISGQDTVCFIDNKDGKIVDGDPARIQSVTFMFAIQYSQTAQD